MLSPSAEVWTGRMDRAYPLWAMPAILQSWGLVKAAFVTTAPMVVFSAKRFPWTAMLSYISATLSLNPFLSGVNSPATLRPVFQSYTSPRALTTTTAPI